MTEITHPIQLSILRNLLLIPQARFRDLNTTGVTNDHFTFHLKRLIELNLVAHKDDQYFLTVVGKELAGRLDIYTSEFVHTPKLGVALTAIRNPDLPEFLLGQRRKDPSIGLWGWFTEKVPLGESFSDVCQRCLNRETGLQAAGFEYVGIARYRGQVGELVEQDVVLICFLAKNVTGELIPQTPDSNNAWVSLDVLKSLPTFEGIDSLLHQALRQEKFFSETISDGETTTSRDRR